MAWTRIWVNGLSLYDLVAADIDLLTRVTGGVIEDDRLSPCPAQLLHLGRFKVSRAALSSTATWGVPPSARTASACGVTAATASSASREA